MNPFSHLLDYEVVKVGLLPPSHVNEEVGYSEPISLFL